MSGPTKCRDRRNVGTVCPLHLLMTCMLISWPVCFYSTLLKAVVRLSSGRSSKSTTYNQKFSAQCKLFSLVLCPAYRRKAQFTAYLYLLQKTRLS